MRNVAKKYRIYEQTQFNTEVIRATWIEKTRKWQLELKVKDTKETQAKLYDFM